MTPSTPLVFRYHLPLRGLGIDSKKSILPVYVAWRAGSSTLHRLVDSIPRLLNRLQIRAQVTGKELPLYIVEGQFYSKRKLNNARYQV